MTNYENQVAKGIDIRLDFEPNYTRIDKAVRLMKATGAKITFYNLDKIRSYDNLNKTMKKFCIFFCFSLAYMKKK